MVESRVKPAALGLTSAVASAFSCRIYLRRAEVEDQTPSVKELSYSVVISAEWLRAYLKLTKTMNRTIVLSVAKGRQAGYVMRWRDLLCSKDI